MSTLSLELSVDEKKRQYDPDPEKKPLLSDSDQHEALDTSEQSVAVWYVYISHFLSAWGDRMWQFGVGLFLVIIAPDSLLLTAIYGFAMGAAILLLGPIVGDWVDKTSRLSAARISLVIQNLSITLCAVVVYFVIVYKEEIETEWPDRGLETLCYAVIIFIAVIAQLASTGNTIAVEKDWIVEICGTNTDLLAKTSAIMKSIDLITNIVAPIATGQIMTFASTEIGALFIGGWNLVSVVVEYWLLWKVYSVVPALRAQKDFCDKAVEKEEVKENKCSRCASGMLEGVLILGRGWKTFMKYDVAFAGLGLATLYMTVLGFDNVTVGFAYTQGVNESIMGGLMAAGALVGILGTIIYPYMRKCIGLQRTGLFALFMQNVFLTLCVVSVWMPGSPFDVNFKSKQQEDSGIITNETEINATTLPPLFNLSTTSMYNVTDTTEKTWEDYISVGMLMFGIIAARCGLWIADLTITQLFLETVVESERGIVFGVQTALNQLMDMLKFALVIIAPEPELFGILVILSYVFVTAGYVLYAKYSYSARGHILPHFGKIRFKEIAGYVHFNNTLLPRDDFIRYHSAHYGYGHETDQ
ncbi:solute carrier family 40 member 1-like [Mya arenaria]|uniref:solute carrier family 40 member 1-like n=1 Tax=Mya arenaria TaxID=6604 RepID=UPI0022E0E3AB|nr:solute carrier family 40 member 1-like [Mya arenaria]